MNKLVRGAIVLSTMVTFAAFIYAQTRTDTGLSSAKTSQKGIVGSFIAGEVAIDNVVIEPTLTDEKAKGKHCDGIAGIIEEGGSVMGEDFDESTMDACLIAAGQRAEHYEMAAYGTLVAWARGMGHTEAADLLEQTLDEEKAADRKLTKLAEGGINQEAADAAHPEQEDEEKATTPSRTRRGAASAADAQRRSRR